MSYELTPFLDLAPGYLCILDAHGRFLEVGSSFTRILGWGPEELQGTAFRDLLHPDERDAGDSLLLPALAGRPVDSLRCKVRTSTGGFRLVEWRARSGPLENTVYAAARDMEDLFRESRRARSLTLAADQSLTGICIIDVEGVITYSNRALTEFLEIPRDEADGDEVLTRLPRPEGKDALRLEHGSPQFEQWEVRVADPDQGARWMDVLVTPVRRESGVVEGHLIRIKDVTERVAAHEALVRASQERDDFLSTMSHELRTPLNAVTTIVESLQEGVYGQVSERQYEALDTVAESGRHLLSLINDILDLAKIRAGELVIHPTRVDVGEICRAAVRLVQGQAERKSQRLSLDLDPSAGQVCADQRRLKQILINLLGNAVKFTPNGGAITLRTRAVDEGEAVDFVVEDNGIGFEKSEVARLLKPFVQAQGELSREQEGTGLGLSLVLRLTELHGGGLSVESAGPGKGSRFTVCLPVGEPTRDSGPNGGAPGSVASALLVEDSTVTSDQLLRYLDELGIRATLNTSGENVVEQAVALQPDMVFLDILLPTDSGWSILRRLAADERTSGIPVIVISVMDPPDRSTPPNLRTFLQKPISRSELASAIAGRPSSPRVSLPRVPSAREGRGNGGPVVTPSSGADDDGGGTRVLLVDDNPVNIAALLPFLESRGYRVSVARGGEEAVSVWQDVRPHVTLMDVQMPEVDGLEATRRIRALEGQQAAPSPIVAVTALAMPGDRERCLEAGVDAYMAKPLSLRELDAVISGLVDGEEES